MPPNDGTTSPVLTPVRFRAAEPEPVRVLLSAARTSLHDPSLGPRCPSGHDGFGGGDVRADHRPSSRQRPGLRPRAQTTRVRTDPPERGRLPTVHRTILGSCPSWATRARADVRGTA